MKLTHSSKFIIRLILYIFIFVVYGLIIYASSLSYEYFTETEEANLILLLAFSPTIYIIILYGEIKKIFDEKTSLKDMSKDKKIYLFLVLLWTIIFFSLLIYYFI
ncbi:hypothetical protein CIL05_12125 [Virgibacillus profundi]|uniref:Uncharacterized protein n=1 Tax=Virgibacillus profundi TaxID=2024555 RepID=A0A2A2IC43_9BACI|nr:hypothetical protein [Virgibacillus profundi]PAV29142.1 hypothetical protein CIL05_12125 [Virgibacillus profundi]PXY53311.1 hypothetical protein CIT14_12250 [Virgibacillus profundi]